MLLTSILFYLLASPLVQAILPIHTRGNRFIRPSSPKNDADDNTVFFVTGIDYQPGGSSGYDPDSGEDALSSPDKCARDAFVFQQLGINTIRIYTLNPDVNHDECMTILNNAGIYIVLDVNSGQYGENLNRADPSGTYNSQYLTRVFKFIDAFKNYPNVLGFFSGNEVINDENDYAEIDPQYIRAVQRDMKQYIKKHANRTIPVGYSAADNIELRLASFQYLQCNSLNGNSVDTALDESKSDFFGLNSYEWCSGTSDWANSGFEKLNSTFGDSVIPLIFSEYGCNKNRPRTFDEVSDGLYGGLIDAFSGGLVYEYSEESNNYGLVELDESDGSITYKKDFDNLKSQFKNLSLPDITESSVKNSTIYQCSSSSISDIFSGFGTKNFTIPDQPEEIASLIKNGVNGTNIGKILTDYVAPSTLNYTIKDSNSKEISATITYPTKNFENSLSTASAEISPTSAASSKVSSTSASSETSSATSSRSKALGVQSASLSTGLNTLLLSLVVVLL